MWILSNNFSQYKLTSKDSINYDLIDTTFVEFYNPVNSWDKNKLIEDNIKLEEINLKFESSN